jgi:transcriptional regulator with XRE-family HTH domain
MPLSGRIRWARKRAGFSQEAFAAQVGTSRRHVMRWEHPVQAVTPTARYVARIAEATGQPEELFEADEDEEAARVIGRDLYRAVFRAMEAIVQNERERVLT